jgi:PAS domain S-box-containing protein
MSSTRRLWLTFWPLALAVGALTIVLTVASNHGSNPVLSTVLALLVSLSFIAAGLVAWSRRPDNDVGRLMVATGFAWFFNPLTLANEAWLFTIASALQALVLAVFVHLLLAFPTGRLETRFERVIVGLAYPAAILANVTQLLVTRKPNTSCDPDVCRNTFLVEDSHAASTALSAFWDFVGIALIAAAVVVLVRRWRNATPAGRRVLWPVLLSGTVTIVLLAIGFALDRVSTSASNGVASLGLLVFITVPYFFLWGLARSRLARADLGLLYAEIPEHPTAHEVDSAFRHALRDPTAQVAVWLPQRDAYVDLDGRPFDQPEGDMRTWTLVEYEGRRVGAIVHDPSLLDEPELLEAAIATARMGLDKDRLAAELRARLVELERERDFVRTVVDTAPALFCVIDLEGRIIRFNAAFERLSGIAEDDKTRGRPFWEVLMPAEEAVSAQAALREPDESRRSAFLGVEGTLRTVDWTLTPIVGAQGNPILLLTGTDVTERERQQAELRVREQQSRALLEAIPDNMFRVRRDGTYVDFHANNPGMLLTPADSIVGTMMASHEAIPSWLVEEISALIDRALETGSLQTLEYHVADSEREARIVPSGPDEVFMIVRDITEQRRQQEELRASEERGRLLLEAIPDIMFRIRRDGTIVDFHAHDPGDLALGPERTLGLNLWDLPDPEPAERIMSAAHVALETGELQTTEYVTSKGVREARILASGPDEVVMISRDISDRKAAEEELRRSRARIVEAADAERRRLERNLHDGAQQRLVSLSLALRLAQSQLGRDPEAAERMLAEAQQELSEALADLRELARGIHPAILTDRGLGPALEALAARAPLPVEVSALPEDPLPGPVQAAAYYVVAEGLTNVVKYARASGVTVCIERVDGLARVEVADDGVGGADPTGGTGLRGLSDRIEALDGRLAVESAPGSGTRLRAEIPV